MSSEAPQRPLEQMGISPEVVLPDGILTPSRAKSIRFSQSRPGYHYEEVEEFVAQVQSSLDLYAKILHGRDLDIHKLDEALSRAQVDLKNKNNQIEVLVAQEGIVQANVDDSEVGLLLEANEKLRTELLLAQQEAEKTKADLEALNVWAEEAEDYINVLKEQVENGGILEETPVNEYIEEEPTFIEPTYVEPEAEYNYEEEIEEEYVQEAPVQIPRTQQTGPKFNFGNPPENFTYPTQDGTPQARQTKPSLPPGIRLDDLE
jgi:hypothetical protein